MNPGVPLAALTGVQVGAALVASAAVVDTTGSALLAFMRYALAALLLVPFAWQAFRTGAPIARRDLLPIALLGIGQFGALIWLLNLAVEFAEPSRVALVFATLPAVTALVLWCTGRGMPSSYVVVGIVGSVAGVALLLGGTTYAHAAIQNEVVGLALAMAATTIAAVCSVLYRPYLMRYGVRRISVLAMIASLVPLALLVPFEVNDPIGTWASTVWLLVAFVGASSAIGYLMWLGALARMDAARVTAFLALSPITAAILSAAFTDSHLASTDFAALALISGALCVIAIERNHPLAENGS